MSRINRMLLMLPFVVFAFNNSADSQVERFRPPAIPLVACDPYFSIWSFSDRPTDEWPRHWTGATQALCGLVRIDGKPLRILGAGPGDVPAMQFTGVTVTPTRTIYAFNQSGIAVTLCFLTPALPNDLSLYARPVTYVSWSAHSTDGRPHALEVYFDCSAELVVNTPDQQVSWSRVLTGGHEVLRIGS